MYRTLFWPVLLPSILIGIALGATAPVSVLAAIELTASPAFASLILALAGAVSLFSTVPAGILIDRIGDRTAMAIGTFAAAVCTAMTIIALVWAGPGSLALFVVSMVLRAPSIAVWSLSRQALVAEAVPVHQRGRAMTALGGTMRVGGLIGPLLGAGLLLVLPIVSVYVLAIVCALLAVAILYTPAGSTLESVSRAAQKKAADAKNAPLPDDIRWKTVILAGISITTLAVARSGQPIVVQLWGVHLELSPSTISLIVAVGAALELVMMVPGGRIKDQLGRSPVLIACLAGFGLGFIIMPLTPHVAGMVIAVLVMAVANGFGAGINMTIGADLSPSTGRARFLGIWALFSSVGTLVGPATISLLVASTGIAGALWGVGAITMAGSAWMAAWARTVRLPKGISAPSTK